jgi:hypothetical protein
MNPKKKKTIIVFTLIFSIFIIIYLVKLPVRLENNEIAFVFNRFEKAYNAGQYQEAYSLMTPQYRTSHDIGEFKKLFDEVEPLERDWDVVRQFGKVHICCNNPGASFSPISTMTYILEKVDDNWYLTGESARFLD